MVTNVINAKGTAILAPGQYRGCWELGKHKGQYKALVQKKNIKVYRDNNRNDVYDMLCHKTDTGVFGLNIHRSNEYRTSKYVDKYSAGCQVFANPKDFDAFIRLCEKQKQLYGNSFTYTLIDESDVR